MEEGDCLFIPYHWFHQVNSVANEQGQNLAVNVWFKHVFNHVPTTCDIEPADATLDKYAFGEDSANEDEGDTGNDEDGEGNEDVRGGGSPL